MKIAAMVHIAIVYMASNTINPQYYYDSEYMFLICLRPLPYPRKTTA